MHPTRGRSAVPQAVGPQGPGKETIRSASGCLFFNVTLSLLRGPSRPSVLGSLATLGADRTKRGLRARF